MDSDVFIPKFNFCSCFEVAVILLIFFTKKKYTELMETAVERMTKF